MFREKRHYLKSERGSDRAKSLQLRSLIYPVQSQWQQFTVFVLAKTAQIAPCPQAAIAQMIYNAYESVIGRWQR